MTRASHARSLQAASLVTAFSALAGLGLGLGGCKPSTPEDHQPRPVTAEEREREAAAQLRLEAAGVVLSLPPGWVALAEDEPNFALASAADDRNPQVPVCTIELRRQGPGALPGGGKPSASDSEVFEYRRGSMFGQVRSLPGPDGSAIVVHCRASRSSSRWPEVVAAMAKIEQPGPAAVLPAELDRGAAASEAIVELCSGTASSVGLICARRVDGAVLCGRSSGATLERIPLAEPALQIGCATASACARLATGEVQCWSGAEPAPSVVAGSAGARDLADRLLVDADGRLQQITDDHRLVELQPLGAPEHALTEVDRVLPGTTATSGCVLRAGALWCWDQAAPEQLGEWPGASDLRRMGKRVCLAVDGSVDRRWTCVEREGDGQGQRHELHGCDTRPCGCSLVGGAKFSCEEAPYDPIDARPLGRIDEVVAIAEPCVALVDGTIVCRGPVLGEKLEDPEATARVASDVPRVAHTLSLPQ
jgi:hypothetical protein